MPVQEMPVQENATQTEMPQDSRHMPAQVWKRRLGPPKQEGAVQFLGWFSIGLGLAEIIFPKKLSRLIGAPARPMTTRMMGFREVAVGAGLLNAARPAPWIRARVAGDAMDLAFLKSAFGSVDAKNGSRTRLTVTTAAVAAITAADMACARKLRCVEPVGDRIRIESSRAVNRSAEECYRFWRDVENHPRFMKDLESVQTTGQNTSRWRMKVNALKTVEWESRLTRDVPGEMIEWQSLPGGDIESYGSVRFEPRFGGQGTTIRLALEFAPPIASAGSLPGRILKGISEHKLQEDLRRFKNLIECGEIPTTEGQPSGREKGARN